MSVQALNARNVAAAKLQECITQLTRYKTSPNPTTRLLQQKLDNALSAIESLREKHYTYAEKANIDLEDGDLVQYLSSKVDPAVDLTDEVYLLIDDQLQVAKADSDKAASQVQKTNEKQVAELQYQTDEKNLRDRLVSLTTYLDTAEKDKEASIRVKAELEEVDESLEQQVKSWTAFKSLLSDPAELRVVFQQEETLRKLYAEKKTEALSFIRALEPEVEVKEVVEPDNSSNTRNTSHVKTEKLSTPTFNGDIRTFAQFKGDFETVIAPYYPDKLHQVNLLKYKALKGPAKALIENMSDLDQIWNRLESRYGNSLEIVSLVVNDIEKLKFNSKDHDKGIVQLVDTLEKGVWDLEAVKSRHEIATAYTVKLLESKLPEPLLNRWYDKEEESRSQSTSTESKPRFEMMLQFLSTERKHAERRILLKHSATPDKKDNQKSDRNQNFSGRTGAADSQKTKNMCLIHPEATHFTRKCNAFRSKTVEERGKLVFDLKACKLCLSVKHPGVDCPFLSKWQPCKVSGCNAFHSDLLHGCSIAYCHTQLTMINKTILLVQRIRVKRGSVNSLFDNGSTISLITKACATRFKLKGTPAEYDLVTVGNTITPQETTVYQFAIIANSNQVYVITAFEIESICGVIQDVNTDELAHLFPRVTSKSISRPYGSIDLLIGMDNAEIHPQVIESKEGLVLYQSKFGSGYVIGGSHKSITNTESLSSVAICARTGISNVRIKRNADPGIDFFTAEAFGVKVPPSCNKCLNCKDCKFATQQLSRIEQRELQVIRSNLKLDPVQKIWTTSYPYKCNPEVLQNNRTQVYNMMLKTEKQLSHSTAAAEAYNEQFESMLERGVLVEIPPKELEDYEGPVNYVTHHVVFKPGSQSTPVRLVVNPSMTYKKVSLNECLMKGPNSLNNLFGIQLRFRTHLVALVGDILKYYHTIHTTEKEKHLRRILWRFMKTDEQPKTYGPVRVMFGDKPAAAISSVAIQETAEMYKNINKTASDKIKDDSYVDDITTGSDSVQETLILKRDMEAILSRGGFRIKGWVMSGDTCKETLSLLGTGEIGRVLGISWDPTDDVFTVHVRINLSRKVKGAHTEKDLTYEEIPRILTLVITRRILLGIVNSCYDPYGLLSPITVQMKIELRKLYGKEANIGWDDPLSLTVKESWVRILQLVKEAEKVQFNRCIKPKAPISGKPILIVTNDGSNDAMCVTAHVRWPLTDGTFECNLYAAKTRVTPLKKETIPRIELQSAVMGSRLSNEIKQHSGLEFEEVVHILDSKCSLAVLHKDSVALRDYMANRGSEILASTTVGQWNWVPSKENISDLGTRGKASINDINEESDWQHGRLWMRQPRDSWPVSQDFTGVVVPENELVKPLLVGHVSTQKPFTLNRFRGRKYTFLLRTIALVIKVLKAKRFSCPPVIAAEIELAEEFCIKLSMSLFTKPEFVKGRFKSLGAHEDEDGIIVVNSRALQEMKLHYGADKFPILTYRDPLSFIWMQFVHQEDHSGITRTVAKSRRKFWIVKARRLAEKVKHSCYRCRLTDKLLAEQKMAPLPTSRMKIAPAFYKISMDLFGPIEIRDAVKKRTTMKVWGVIFNCTVSRAMYLDLTEDYGTDSILQTIRKFVSIRGCPSEIYSDQGSQLVAASKEIAALVADWDWSVVHEWTATEGITWTLAPAEGQHTNGLSESLIKSVKRTLKNKIPSSTLTFSQLQMVMFEVANIINSRPIGIVTGSDPEHPCPITPNDLILGRATSSVPQGPFDTQQSGKVAKQFRFLQSLVSSWWKTWYQTVFPSLVPSYKWLQRHRNLRIGDICLIRYRNDIRATYRLGRVTETKKGDDGLVRTIVLQYKLPNEKVFRTVDRPIQGVAVIVPVEEQEGSQMNPDAPVFTPSQ